MLRQGDASRIPCQDPHIDDFLRLLREQVGTLHSHHTPEDEYLGFVKALNDIDEAFETKHSLLLPEMWFLRSEAEKSVLNRHLNGAIKKEGNKEDEAQCDGSKSHEKKTDVVLEKLSSAKLLSPISLVGENLSYRNSILYRHLEGYGDNDKSLSKTAKNPLISRLTSSPLKDLSLLRNTSRRPTFSSQGSRLIEKEHLVRSASKSSANSVPIDQALVTSEADTSFDYLLPLIAKFDNPPKQETIFERARDDHLQPNSQETEATEPPAPSFRSIMQPKTPPERKRSPPRKAAKRKVSTEVCKAAENLFNRKMQKKSPPEGPEWGISLQNRIVWLPDNTFISGLPSSQKSFSEKNTLQVASPVKAKTLDKARDGSPPVKKRRRSRKLKLDPGNTTEPPTRENNRARSRMGCWTCRIRHKGCSEQRPICENCRQLGLFCDYSSQRPLYMTCKLEGKEKLREIRRITDNPKRHALQKRESSLSVSIVYKATKASFARGLE